MNWNVCRTKCLTFLAFVRGENNELHSMAKSFSRIVKFFYYLLL